jgi:outer membrane protein assembly factor BamB
MAGLSFRSRSMAALLAAVVVAAVPGGASAGPPSGTSITLDPDHGPPTTRTTVTGTGFGSVEQVVITFGSKEVGTATTDEAGSFSKNITVPRTARPGDHPVTATGQSSGLSASAMFLVRTDWTDFHFDLANSGFNPYENVLKPSNVAGLRQAWSFETGDQIFSSPAVVGGVVYVGSFDDYLYALDAVRGTLLWSYSNGDGYAASPAVVGGTVYIGQGRQVGGGMLAVDGATGHLQWSHQTPSVASSPSVADGTVYFGCADSKVYALHAATGTLKWSFATRRIIQGSPAVAAGVVYVGSNDRHLYALDAATGKRKWQYKLGGVHAFPAYSSPAVAGGLVYIGAHNGKVFALDAAKGSKRWTRSTGDFVNSSPAVANGVLYVGSADNHLYAFDAATGVRLWQWALALVSSSPAVADGMVFVGSYDRYVHAFRLP